MAVISDPNGDFLAQSEAKMRQGERKLHYCLCTLNAIDGVFTACRCKANGIEAKPFLRNEFLALGGVPDAA